MITEPDNKFLTHIHLSFELLKAIESASPGHLISRYHINYIQTAHFRGPKSALFTCILKWSRWMELLGDKECIVLHAISCWKTFFSLWWLALNMKQQISIVCVHWWYWYVTLICHDWEMKLTSSSSINFSSLKCYYILWYNVMLTQQRSFRHIPKATLSESE